MNVKAQDVKVGNIISTGNGAFRVNEVSRGAYFGNADRMSLQGRYLATPDIPTGGVYRHPAETVKVTA